MQPRCQSCVAGPCPWPCTGSNYIHYQAAVLRCNLQEIYGQLEEAGHLVEQEIQQLYSEAAGKFLADRFVIGTCPKCGFDVSPPRQPHTAK